MKKEERNSTKEHTQEGSQTEEIRMKQNHLMEEKAQTIEEFKEVNKLRMKSQTIKVSKEKRRTQFFGQKNGQNTRVVHCHGEIPRTTHKDFLYETVGSFPS